jgi:hypothetical protein
MVRRVAAVGTYMIVRDGECTFLHNNLGAYEILEVSVAGPEITLRFLDTYHRLAFDGEADTGWRPDWFTYGVSEGGLLVDCDKQVLMVFTEHRSWSVRAAYLDTVRRTWPGWQVRWAYDGIAELVRYAGLDPTGEEQHGRGQQPLYERGRRAPARLVYLVTVARPGARPAVYGLTSEATLPWWVGPDLLDALGEADLDPTFRYVPWAGMHLDPAARTAGVWTVNRALTGLVEDWPELWPGWRLEFWEDRFQEQLERCGDGAVAVTVPDAQRCGLALANCVVNTWLFFLAEDVDRNYRTLQKEGERTDRQRQEVWKLTREQTAMTRSDMAKLLLTITGRPHPRPRWPKTMYDLRRAPG